MQTKKIKSHNVEQVVKEYIHFDCPFCDRSFFATAEDGGSDVYEACIHFQGFEWQQDQDIAEEGWVATFQEGK